MTDSAAFVGRTSELAELERALADARDGRGAFVLVAGEPGIGKTTLCTCFCARALDHGVRSLWGRAWEWGGAPPFWPWIQVFRALGGASIFENAVGDRFALFDSVTESLRSQARENPLVIVLEDLHASDVPSLLLLRFAVEQLRDAAVLIVGTWRTVESSPSEEAASLMADISRVGRALDLSGFPAGEIAELMRSVAEHPDLSDAARLYDRTGGNPLLVASLLQSGAHAVASSTVPLRARVAVERRVARLDGEVRAVLGAASVIGREMPVLLLARVCDRPLEQVLQRVRTLIDERILVERHGAPGRYGFCHGLFREVVYAALSPAERLALHRSAGFALEQLYGDERKAHLPELARHFLAVAPDAERGVEYASGAGDQAMRSLAYEEAVAHFARAIDALQTVSPDPARLARLWCRLAEAQAASGATVDARDNHRRAYRLALETEDADLEARVAIGFARLAGFGSADEESARWLERALEHASSVPTRVRLQCALIERHAGVVGAKERAEALSEEVIALARTSADRQLYAHALAATLVMVWMPESSAFAGCRERSEELLRVAEELDDPELRVEAYRWRFTVCMIHGALDDAKRALDAYERVGAQLARPQLRFNALLRRIMLACIDGRFDLAAQLIGEMDSAARRAGDAQGEFLRLSAEFQFARARGDTASFESLPPFEAVVGTDWPSVGRLAIRANQFAELGRKDEARRALDAFFDRVPAFPANGAPMALAGAARVAWLLGDAARARELLPLLLPHEGLVLMAGAIHFLGPASLYLGFAFATLGDAEQATKHLGRALAELERMGTQIYVPEVRAVLASLGGNSSDTAPALRGGASQPPADLAANLDGVFAAEGDYYAVGLGPNLVRVRSSKGLAFIEALLRREDTDVHVLELGGSALEDRDRAPLLDERAKAEYRARVEELRAELDEAEQFGDRGRESRMREELDLLLAELSRATGLGGRDRPTGTAERARARVTLAIRRAMRALKHAHPTLAAHFTAAINTGTFCSYRPEPRARVRWRFAPSVDS